MSNMDDNLEAHRFDVNDRNASLLNATVNRNSEIDIDDYNNNDMIMDGKHQLKNKKHSKKDLSILSF